MSSPEYVVRVPAKVNLYLRVVARRPDGYHELETVMQSVGLYDQLRLRPATELRLVGEHPGVPSDESNLAMKAALALRAWAGVPTAGAEIELGKQIPAGAGLGGGSADAAAALAGLSGLWGLRLHRDELHDLAASLGSDVPFFLEGGTAVARGRGERLTPVPSPPPLWLVLVKPPFPVSTPWAYRAWSAGPCEGASLDEFLAALRSGDPAAVAAHLRNDLEPGVTAGHAEIALLRHRLLDLGALGARMTGSGSAVFALTPGEPEAHRIAADLGPDHGERFVVTTLAKGTE